MAKTLDEVRRAKVALQEDRRLPVNVGVGIGRDASGYVLRVNVYRTPPKDAPRLLEGVTILYEIVSPPKAGGPGTW